MDSIQIAPQSEMIIEGVPLGFIDKEGTGLVPTCKHLACEKGLLAAKAFVCPSSDTVSIAYPHHKVCKISGRTVVASYKPLDLLEENLIPVKGMHLIVLGFNDTSTLEGHFVSSPREREKRDRRESRGDEREGQGRKRNRNESEETEEIKTFPLYPYPLQG